MKTTIIFLSIFAIICALAVAVNKSDNDLDKVAEQETYNQWTKTYRYNIPFEQWKRMKENELLPKDPRPFTPLPR